MPTAPLPCFVLCSPIESIHRVAELQSVANHLAPRDRGAASPASHRRRERPAASTIAAHAHVRIEPSACSTTPPSMPTPSSAPDAHRAPPTRAPARRESSRRRRMVGPRPSTRPRRPRSSRDGASAPSTARTAPIFTGFVEPTAIDRDRRERRVETSARHEIKYRFVHNSLVKRGKCTGRIRDVVRAGLG